MKLDYPKAIVLAAVVFSVIIAAAIAFVGTSELNAQMGGGKSGGYMIAGDGSQFVWVVNTSTGAVSYCVRRDNSSDPALISRRPPYCSAESAAR